MAIDIKALRNLVYEKGITYVELSRMSGISKTHISRIFDGKNKYNCRPNTIKALADALGVGYKEIVLEEC